MHPGVALQGRAPGDHARLPCFVLGRRRAILPAFGGFTGLALVAPARGERIVAIAGTQLFPLAGHVTGGRLALAHVRAGRVAQRRVARLRRAHRRMRTRRARCAESQRDHSGHHEPAWIGVSATQTPGSTYVASLDFVATR